MRRLIAAGPAVAYAALIFYLSSRSSFPFPPRLWDFDKALHAIEYAGLGFLTARAVWSERAHAPRTIAILIASLYGATDELHQLFVPGRTCDLRDWLADTAGAVIGVLVFERARRVWPGRGT